VPIGHPDFVHIGSKVAEALGLGNDENDASVRQVPVVVVGQGNVALDCARILAKGSNGLYDTDLASHALKVLGEGVSNISVIGRRGHVQGAFTIKELRELVKLEEEGFDTAFVVRNDELELGSTAATKEELAGAQGRPKARIDALLRQAAATGEQLSFYYMIIFVFHQQLNLSGKTFFLSSRSDQIVVETN
jgi:adrenodoxin-NADP+ reductase